jgi:hypothetical protein
VLTTIEHLVGAESMSPSQANRHSY